MDAESWPASGEYSRGVADNTPWGSQALNNTNDISSQYEKGKTEGNYGETWDEDFENAYPPSLQVLVKHNFNEYQRTVRCYILPMKK